MGVLRDPDTGEMKRSALVRTKYLPSLDGVVWREENPGEVGLDTPLQLFFRRPRIDFQILKHPSDPKTKFDLFQRLNRGGAYATEQEVRTCSMVIANANITRDIRALCATEMFRSVFRLTDEQRNQQRDLEYAVRMMVHTAADLPRGSDVQEFLDRTIIEILSTVDALDALETVRWTVSLLHRALGDDALIPVEDRAQGIAGRFSLRALEGIAVGIARNRRPIQALPDAENYVTSRINSFWQQQDVADMSAAGLRVRCGFQEVFRLGPAGLIRMPDATKYFDAIDASRIQRAFELSEIKFNFTTDKRPDPLSIRSKAVVVLVYANWEGFYNDCVTIFLDFLSSERVAITSASWLLLVGALSGEFNALRDRHHSGEARRIFVEKLKLRLTSDFGDFDRSVVMARSNLDFETLRSNLTLLDFDETRLLRSRIRLNKELVGWRHAVAHGSPPDLSKVDVVDHVDFASNLMLDVSDLFQEAILKHLP